MWQHAWPYLPKGMDQACVALLAGPGMHGPTCRKGWTEHAWPYLPQGIDQACVALLAEGDGPGMRGPTC